MTWAEILDWKQKFMDAVQATDNWRDWFTAAGVGFDTLDNSYRLHLYVHENKDIETALRLLHSTGYTGKWEIKVLSNILPL